LGRLELAEVLHAERSAVDVHAANTGIALLDAIHRLDGTGEEVDAGDPGLLARNEQQTLVPHAQQCAHFLSDLVLRQRLARQTLVVLPEAAVQAVVVADVGDVERGKEHNAPAVDALLYGERGVLQSCLHFRILAIAESSRLHQAQSARVASRLKRTQGELARPRTAFREDVLYLRIAEDVINCFPDLLHGISRRRRTGLRRKPACLPSAVLLKSTVLARRRLAQIRRADI